MPGVSNPTLTSRLHKIQSFKEAVWGTPGVATARWMGVAPYPTFKPYVKSTNYDEDRGGLQNAYLSNVLQNGGEYTVNWTYASYEDILFALQNVLQAVAPTGGGPYTWTYLAPTTSANDLQPYSLEWGHNIVTGRYAGCLGQKLTIKGEAKKQWELALNGFYKSYTPNAAINIASSTNASPIEITTATDHGLSTGMQVFITGHLVNTAANGTWVVTVVDANQFTLDTSVGNGVGVATGTVTKIETPSIADRTIEAIIFPGTTLAIEAAGGTPGTTPFANVFLGFTLDIENNVLPIWTGDALAPATYAYDKLKAVLSLKLLYNAQVKAWVYSTLAAGGRAVVQIKQISSTKSIELDFAGVLIDDPSQWGNQDGATMIEVKLEAQYDSGPLANSLKAIVVNGVSALP